MSVPIRNTIAVQRMCSISKIAKMIKYTKQCFFFFSMSFTNKINNNYIYIYLIYTASNFKFVKTLLHEWQVKEILVIQPKTVCNIKYIKPIFKNKYLH